MLEKIKRAAAGTNAHHTFSSHAHSSCSESGVEGPSSHEHPPENVKPDDDMCTFSREASMQPAFTSSGVVASELNQNLGFHGPIPPNDKMTAVHRSLFPISLNGTKLLDIPQSKCRLLLSLIDSYTPALLHWLSLRPEIYCKNLTFVILRSLKVTRFHSAHSPVSSPFHC
jgi:hypothetical protein